MVGLNFTYARFFMIIWGQKKYGDRRETARVQSEIVVTPHGHRTGSVQCQLKVCRYPTISVRYPSDPRTALTEDVDIVQCPYIYIFIAIALDENIFLDVLHFSMKNIKSRDLDATRLWAGWRQNQPVTLFFKLETSVIRIFRYPHQTPLFYRNTGVWRDTPTFLFLIKNIHCGYTLETPCIKNKKSRCIPPNPSVSIKKWGLMGYTFQGHVIHPKFK